MHVCACVHVCARVCMCVRVRDVCVCVFRGFGLTVNIYHISDIG